MAWARVDDGLHSHPKIRKLSFAARGVLLTALSYAAHYETDGVLDLDFVKSIEAKPTGRAAVKELTVAGVLEPCVGGAVAIHDYLDYNPSRAELDAKRGDDRRRQRKKRSQVRLWTGESDPTSQRDSQPMSHPESDTGLGRGRTSSTEDQDDLTGARADWDECEAWVDRHFQGLSLTQRAMVTQEANVRSTNVGTNGAAPDCSVAAIHEWMRTNFNEEATA